MQTEVETAVRERLPIMTILLNNARMDGYDRHMPAASARFGTNRLSGHYAGVAAELGAYSERVEDPADVAAAIGRGIAATRAGRPVVLEMITKEEPGLESSKKSGDQAANAVGIGAAYSGGKSGYQVRNVSAQSALSTFVRTWRSRWAPSGVHCICCCLTMRLLTT